jgi:hypothetical protein
VERKEGELCGLLWLVHLRQESHRVNDVAPDLVEGHQTMMTAEEFNRAVESAEPGEMIPYFFGPYLGDEQRELADAAYAAFSRSEVHLFQRRVTKSEEDVWGEFEYLAIKRGTNKEPPEDGAPLSAKQAEMAEIRK